MEITLDELKRSIPLGPRVLVKEDKMPEKSTGGIYYAPDKIKDYQNQSISGTIVKYGETAFEHMLPSRDYPAIGAKILYIKYAGNGLTIDNIPYRILNDEDVTLIIPEEKEDDR
jgi:co-chaperonin GroES (HSP10)